MNAFKNQIVGNKILFFCVLICLLFPSTSYSLISIKGNVSDKLSGDFLTGASVQISNSYLSTLTDDKGIFILKKLKPGSIQLKVSFLGYTPEIVNLNVLNDTTIEVGLLPKSFLQEEIIVEATRANSKTPTSFTQLNKEEIAQNNLGQDLPYLLNLQPSVVITSDAGTGVGYTGIRIRGTDGTRINTTINGIPLNDAESQISYFVDVPDLLSSTDNIQIQRGVGTSTNGAGAFGGSINIETSKLNVEPYANIALSVGSFNTVKNTFNIGSGLVNNKFSFDGRLSKIASDGFIDRGKSKLESYYLSGGYYGKNTTLKFITFSGNEKTYQCWNGVPESKLNGNSEELLDFIERNYLSADAAKNIIHSNNRTYNSFTYQNQIDNYKQQNYQLHFSQRIKNYWNLNAALHYTKGQGYYEEYKEAQTLSEYNLENPIIGNDTVLASNLVRQKWLDNDFYGITYAVNYNRNKNFSATIGGAYNIYDGDHFGKVIWAQYNAASEFDKKYYNDKGLKKDFNLYLKINYQLNRNFNLFADVQMRSVDYSFVGYNELLNQEKQNVKLNFWNPKVGISYFLSSNKTMYFSYAIANKEPSRDDYVQSSTKSQPLSEKLNNVEFGYVQKNKRYTYTFNTYYMNYQNQLVLNGKVNDVGAYNRSNVKSSYRLGIEWMNTIQLFKQWEWSANATWSINKVRNYTEYIDNYDSTFAHQEMNNYSSTDISFSPAWVAGSSLKYSPIKNLAASFITKYVGQQYLDNTSNAGRMLDAYLVNDLHLTYAIHPKHMKEILLSAAVNNLFNEMYESNGYTYNYIYGGKLVVENFYFPQAGINYLAGIMLKF